MELKDLLAEFDIKAEDVSKLTVDDVRKQRDEKWIGRAVVAEDPEIVKALTGKITGSYTTALKGAFKDLDIEFAPEEIKDKKPEEIVRIGTQKAKGIFEAIKQKQNDGNDKKLTDLQAQFDTQKKKLTETEDVLKTSQALVEQTKSESAGVIKTFKLNHALTAAKAKVPFSESADDYKKRGFDAVFNETYKVDLNENDELVLMNKDGSRVKSATGGNFISFEEGYKSELDKAGMLKKNNAGGKPAPVLGGKPDPDPTNGKVFSLPKGMDTHVAALNG